MPRVSAMAPKGLVASLPARCSNTRLHGAFKRPKSQSYGRSSSKSGRSWLVAMAHSMSDSDKERSAAGGSAFKQELLRMRNKVASLDGELEAAQTLLSKNELARAQEKEQLAALQTETTSLQAQWVTDQKALQDSADQVVNVEESDASVREVQGQAVQLGDRVSKLQTLLLDQDETLAELRQKLRAAKPQLAMVGAGSATLDDDLMASFRSGSTMQRSPSFEGLGGAWDMTTSPDDVPAQSPAKSNAGKAIKDTENVMRTPKALGVTFLAATFAAASVAAGIWGTVRRVAPQKMRGPLDFMASAAVTTLVASAAVLMG